MSELINQLGGSYFEFIVVEKEKLWERRGRVQRVVGIKHEYFHHPDALRLPDCVISVFVEAFKLSHERFAYYGYTIYEMPQLIELRVHLLFQSERIKSCQDEAIFRAMLSELFISYCDEAFEVWRDKWKMLQAELLKCIERIFEKAGIAQGESKELLVLGI